jgi:hypothetical protein
VDNCCRCFFGDEKESFGGKLKVGGRLVSQTSNMMNIRRMFSEDDMDDDFMCIKNIPNNFEFDPLYEEEEEENIPRKADRKPSTTKSPGPESNSLWSKSSNDRDTPRKAREYFCKPHHQIIEEGYLKTVSREIKELVSNSVPLSGLFALARSSFDMQGLNGDMDEFIPAVEDIHSLLSAITSNARIEYEVLLIALIYIRRITCRDSSRPLDSTPITLSPKNWKGITVSCLLLAFKAWDDHIISNHDFIRPLHNMNFTSQYINHLEIELLKFLNFDIFVKPQEFSTCHQMIIAKTRDYELDTASISTQSTTCPSPSPSPLRSIYKSLSWKNKMKVGVEEGVGSYQVAMSPTQELVRSDSKKGEVNDTNSMHSIRGSLTRSSQGDLGEFGRQSSSSSLRKKPE